MHLAAVVLDVDGTLVDSERDGHRVAFNQAFQEFGLPYRWDVEEYGRLLAVTGGKRRIAGYLADHGVPEAERDELAARLHRRKTELFQELVADGRIESRPGAAELLEELEVAGVRLAVATTGSGAWVEPLLDRLFGLERFEVIVAGDDVVDRKPDPAAHVLTLERLGVGASRAVAIEDSRNGLLAAKGASLPCAMVVNGYTAGEDLSEADLVLDGFGTTAAPAAVFFDPLGLAPPGRLDVATLDRLVEPTRLRPVVGRGGVTADDV